MSDGDQVQRFLFTASNIRGELAGLSNTYQAVVDKHDYPEDVQILLGEFLAATALLSSTIKFKGSLILQVKGNGRLALVMAECHNQKYLRAIARFNQDPTASASLLGEGQLAITIEPDSGQRYQGIVQMDHAGLASALESYFLQSEQLKTRIWLAADARQASGLLLQVLPGQTVDVHPDEENNAWRHIHSLAGTMSDQELINDGNVDLLNKIFHEESIRVFKPRPLTFQCHCSIERSAQAVLSLGASEAKEILQQDGVIDIDCQFCLARYQFYQKDVDELFRGQIH